MHNTKINEFFGASDDLSTRGMPPTFIEERRLAFGGPDSRIRTVALGRMVAQVTIVPANSVDRVTLMAYSSDRQMRLAVRGRIEDGTLTLDGKIPFEPGNSGALIIGNMTITGASFSQSLIEGSDGSIIIDGRKVDFDRAVRFALLVPSTVNVTVSGEFIGAVGISDSLDGELTFKPSIRAQLTASNVRSLAANVSGLSGLSVTSVTEHTTVFASANSRVVLGTAQGNVRTVASGRAIIAINGGMINILEASTLEGGTVSHRGVVREAWLNASRSSHTRVACVVDKVSVKIEDSGQVTYNGITYHNS